MELVDGGVELDGDEGSAAVGLADDGCNVPVAVAELLVARCRNGSTV